MFLNNGYIPFEYLLGYKRTRFWVWNDIFGIYLQVVYLFWQNCTVTGISGMYLGLLCFKKLIKLHLSLDIQILYPENCANSYSSL